MDRRHREPGEEGQDRIYDTYLDHDESPTPGICTFQAGTTVTAMECNSRCEVRRGK